MFLADPGNRHECGGAEYAEEATCSGLAVRQIRGKGRVAEQSDLALVRIVAHKAVLNVVLGLVDVGDESFESSHARLHLVTLRAKMFTE